MATLPASDFGGPAVFSPAFAQVVRLGEDERDRLKRLELAWKMYHGEHPPALKVKPEGGDDNVIVNVCKAIVDKGVSFLVGEDVDIGPADDVDDAEANTIDDALKTVWSPHVNRRRSWLHRLAQNGGVTGQLVAKLQTYPDRPADPPKLQLIDPANLAVYADPDDWEDIVEYRITWTRVDVARRQAEVRRQRIMRDGVGWLIIDEVSRGDSNIWQELKRTVWPYRWAPIVCAQNLPVANEWWGAPDLTADVIAANNAINRVLSNTSRIIRFHAHPKTWVKGAKVMNMEVNVDGTIELPDGAEIGALEMKGDLASSLAVYERLKSALHEVSRVPEVAVGKLDNIGQLSGLALKILYGPLIEKTSTKQLFYGEFLVDLAARAAAIVMKADELPELTVTWPDPLPQDDAGDAAAAKAKQDAGVSKHTTVQEMGYDPDMEAELRAEETTTVADAVLNGFNAQ